MKKEHPITFGNLITDEEAASNYGFVYLVVVTKNPSEFHNMNNVFYYVGSKSFKDSSWKTYITSSEHCKPLVRASQEFPEYVQCRFHILELVDERHFGGKPGNMLKARETKYIHDYYNRFGSKQTLNICAGRRSLRTGKVLIHSRKH